MLTATGEAEALTLTRLIPRYGQEPETRLIAIARWLAQLYPAIGDKDQLVISALESDRLGEVLVGDVLRQYPDLLAGALDTASDRQLTQALTVSGRIATYDPVGCHQLQAALDQRLDDLYQRAFSSGHNTLLEAVTTAMTISRPTQGALATADRFPDTLPVWLRPLASAVTSLAAEGLRTRASDDPAAVSELARVLNNLATRLQEAGQSGEAVEIAREAVMHYRQLAHASPDAHLSDLAESLNNLANILSEAGRRDEALEMSGEAVAVRRQLAESSSSYLPGLAMALNNMATFLSETGRRDEALEMSGEAVAIRRQLAESSSSYLPDLAMSLNNMATFLSETGRRDEALGTAHEAVAIWRQLAESSPAVYLPDLAASLNNMANRLSEAGRRDEALEMAGEAVAIWRQQLAEASPAAYLPDLAMSLNNMATFLSETGRRDEALGTAHEAVAIRRQLAESSPAVYLPDLAASLNNMANRLSEAGRRDEALEMAGEAVAVLRQLAEVSPAAYLPDLAMSLNNMATFLSETGRRDEALGTAHEAVAIRRQLAEASPAAYLPDLAMSLNIIAALLGQAGRRDEALGTAREAVAIRQQLAESSPAAYLPDLAASLNNMATFLSEAGRRDEALEMAGKAVAIRQQLAESSAATYLPDLAASLNNMATFLSETGRRDEAVGTAREAVAIRRQLAEASPAAYLPGLAASLNNMATFLSEAGRRDEAVGTAREAVAIRRQLAESNPAVYLSGLAASLNNMASILSEAGRSDEADKLFADIRGRFTGSPLGMGQILLAQGRWRIAQNDLEAAVADLAAAISTSDDIGDRVTRGRARRQLRELREQDSSSFDHAWDQTNTPLPVWLQYLVVDDDLTTTILDWIRTADWPGSMAYLDQHAAALLTEQAEATIEHLIDINPAISTLQDHLTLLQAARAYGSDAAYAAHEERILTAQLAQTLQDWLETPTWEASKAFAIAHTGELLHPLTLAILDGVGDNHPADQVLRLHRGLLTYAAAKGFDAAYTLRADVSRRRTAFTASDPAPPAIIRLALARLHSGQSSDDPDAHFQLATTTLLAGNLREASSALADCADNAAPYERRELRPPPGPLRRPASRRSVDDNRPSADLQHAPRICS